MDKKFDQDSGNATQKTGREAGNEDQHRYRDNSVGSAARSRELIETARNCGEPKEDDGPGDDRTREAHHLIALPEAGLPEQQVVKQAPSTALFQTRAFGRS